MIQPQLQNMIQNGENVSVEFKRCTNELTYSVFEKKFSDRVITENWTKPVGQNPVTLENLETHTKNPMIARVFKELGWVEELGSGRKNIKRYAPYYYPNYRIEIENKEKFVFSMTYADENDNVNGNVNENVNEKINDLEITENQSNRIYMLIDEKINEVNEKINEANEKINENVNEENGDVNERNGDVNEENGNVNEENGDVNEENGDVNENVKLNKNVKKNFYTIISSLYNHPKQKRKDLIRQTQKGKSTMDRYLNILKDANIIEFIGSDKTGGYYLTKEAKLIIDKDG